MIVETIYCAFVPISNIAMLQIKRNRVIDFEIVIDEFDAAETVGIHSRRLS